MYFCIRIHKMMVTVYVTNLSTYKIVQPLHFFRQEKLANLSDLGKDFAIDRYWSVLKKDVQLNCDDWICKQGCLECPKITMKI